MFFCDLLSLRLKAKKIEEISYEIAKYIIGFDIPYPQYFYDNLKNFLLFQ